MADFYLHRLDDDALAFRAKAAFRRAWDSLGSRLVTVDDSLGQIEAAYRADGRDYHGWPHACYNALMSPNDVKVLQKSGLTNVEVEKVRALIAYNGLLHD